MDDSVNMKQTFYKGFCEEELLFTISKCHKFLSSSHLRTLGLSLCGLKMTVAAPCNLTRAKRKYYISILKEKELFPADFSLWLGPEIFPESVSTSITSKENETTRTVFRPGLLEAPIPEQNRSWQAIIHESIQPADYFVLPAS